MIRAISLWQPWASLWGTPVKPYETRHWPTSHRGMIAIHAAKKKVPVSSQVDRICREMFGANWRETLPRGALIGHGILHAVCRTETLTNLTDDQYECGDFGPDRFGWLLTELVTLKTPAPLIGRQGLFLVDGTLLREAA